MKPDSMPRGPHRGGGMHTKYDETTNLFNLFYELFPHKSDEIAIDKHGGKNGWVDQFVNFLLFDFDSALFIFFGKFGAECEILACCLSLRNIEWQITYVELALCQF